MPVLLFQVPKCSEEILPMFRVGMTVLLFQVPKCSEEILPMFRDGMTVLNIANVSSWDDFSKYCQCFELGCLFYYFRYQSVQKKYFQCFELG